MIKLLIDIGSRYSTHYGVLETPCYPAMYYGGAFRFGYNNEPSPTDNDTCNYFRDMNDALEHADRLWKITDMALHLGTLGFHQRQA